MTRFVSSLDYVYNQVINCSAMYQFCFLLIVDTYKVFKACSTRSNYQRITKFRNKWDSENIKAPRAVFFMWIQILGNCLPLSK